VSRCRATIEIEPKDSALRRLSAWHAANESNDHTNSPPTTAKFPPKPHREKRLGTNARGRSRRASLVREILRLEGSYIVVHVLLPGNVQDFSRDLS
jgi:hypothetical protein